MRRILACALAVCLPAAARANDFVDTRLNFTLTDENLLVSPGETNPSVPGIHIGQPSSLGLLFFDNYDTRYTGYENLTHLVLYKRITGQRFEAEGALVMRFLEFSDVNLSNIDDGSYIKLTVYKDPSRQDKSNLSFVAFPMSADRMRLGYSYRLSWGGSPIFFKFNPDLPTSAQVPVNSAPAPGARLQWSTDRYNIWVGGKTSLLLNRNPNVNEQEAVYGILAGGSVDLVPNHVRFDVNGGYFYRGTNQNLYTTQQPVNGVYTDYPVSTVGASFQISAFDGLSPSGSLDYALYRNDPTTAVRYFSRPEYKPGFNWLAQSEFTVIYTSLQDGDKTASTTWQQALAGDINLRAQYGHLRMKLDAMFRSLEFVLLNQPSLVPYQAFPVAAQAVGDKFISLGVDYNFARIGLTLGPTVGIDFPANYSPPSGASLPSQLCGNVQGTLCDSTTIVVRGEGDYSLLPQGQTPQPIFAAKLVAREDFLDYFALILDVYYSHDSNQTILTKNPNGDGTLVRQFGHCPNGPNSGVACLDQLGFNFTLQARF